MAELDILLNNKLKEAQQGRDFWLNLKKTYQFGENDYILLMPSQKREYNDTALLYLKQFYNTVKANKIFILTFDPITKQKIEMDFSDIARLVNITREQAEHLMTYYCLTMFTDKLIVISLEEPEGRHGMELIGKNGLTIDEIVAIGIYGLRDFVKAEKA